MFYVYGILYFLGSLLLGLFLGPIIIPKLADLKFGQAIREEGPQSHLQKRGTPTMGGIIFILAFLIPMVIPFTAGDPKLQLVMLSIVIYGAIGFLDDYLIVVKKDNKGLKARYKLLWQMVNALFLMVLSLNLGTWLHLPLRQSMIDLSYFYYLIVFIVLIGVNNAVNLTDGLDGLNGSVTAAVAVGFAYFSFIQGEVALFYFNLSVVGALLAYLKFNWYPAKVFMGDTGSLALGGYVAMMAVVLDLVLFLPIIGVIYFLETLSVIIQVTVFKRTGKRVFKMTPIHHHFELCNWTEVKIVKTFTCITILGILVSILLY